MVTKQQFLAKKIHFWRGTYPRIFVVGSNGAATTEISSHVITNEFTYQDQFVSLEYNSKDGGFSLTYKKQNGYKQKLKK